MALGTYQLKVSACGLQTLTPGEAHQLRCGAGETPDLLDTKVWGGVGPGRRKRGKW